jgi:SPP1 gp7 family putative phage head morphogenesis protein
MADYIVKRADREEVNFRKRLTEEFGRQKDEVLGSIAEKEFKKIGFNFDIEKEEGIFVKVFSPFLMDIIERHGDEALDLIGSDREFQTAAERVAQFLKTRGTQFAKNVNQTTKDKINQAISDGMAAGEGITEIKQRISDVFEEAIEARAYAIARTEVSRASNFATIEGYRQSGVVEKKEWLTAMDERTCDYCASMDGKIVSLEETYFDEGDRFEPAETDRPMKLEYEDIEGPPLHVNCRCTIMPVME